MSLGLKTALSVFANILLLCLAARLASSLPRISRTGADDAALASTSGASRRVEQAPDQPEAITVTNRFAWAQIESADFEKLAANLRGVGCPENAIHLILEARARRMLKRVSSDTDDVAGTPFWQAGLKAELAHRAHLERTTQQENHVRDMFRRATGTELLDEPSEDLAERAVSRFIVGPMADAKYRGVFTVMKRCEQAQQALQRRTEGIVLDEDVEEEKRITAEARHNFERLLTPAELEEMLARFAILRILDEAKFDPADFSPSRVRDIGVAVSKVVEPDFNSTGGRSDSPRDEPIRSAI